MTVPIQEYIYKFDYLYIPLIFEPEEYEQFVEISYIDREVLDNIQQVTKQDIFNLVLMRFKLKFNILKMLNFKDIINNIITSSEGNNKVIDCIYSSLRHDENYYFRIIDKYVIEIN